MMIALCRGFTKASSHVSAFLLDPRLEADSVAVASLALSDLRLMKDARFPWLLLVPRRAGVTEIIDLDERDRLTLFGEINGASSALKAATACDKLNVAAIGNLVPQLHIHVVARFRTDPVWPRPVWGSGAAVAYDEAARDRLVSRILASLPMPPTR
jgi:diadenosine tetraphosphate (Ap4A) HIT family hydrolase